MKSSSANPRFFPCAVVGESFDNSDGANRQDIIRRCIIGEPVTILPEPDNSVDANALKVCRVFTGEQIGYIKQDEAPKLRKELAGKVSFAVIWKINGGKEEKRELGVVLRIMWMDKGDAQADLAAIAEAKLRK